MTQFTLDQVLVATHGQVLMSGVRPMFNGVSTDTRTLQPGDLFVAIRGERMNGHDFLAQAREKGAAGALVQDEVPGTHPRRTVQGEWYLVEVTDTLYALGLLAQYHRRRFKIPIVGITGSAGKTTTKEMTAAILAEGREVLKTPGNFNNEIGMPLTLLNLTSAHQAAVLEFGMRGRGQIGYLASLAHPNIGVITNIGLTHLELLGSQEEIALAKSELLDAMSPQTTAILPERDAFYPLLREHARGTVLTVGEDATSDFRAGDIALGEGGCASFTLYHGDEAIPIHLSVPGQHQVWNALAASAAAITAGATAQQVQEGLAGYAATDGRMRLHRAPGGFSVVDDTYNANPAAVRATLEFLAQLPGGRKIAILGDMRELGSAERDLHRDIGRYARQLGVDALIAVGELGREYVTGAADARAQWCPDNAAAAQTARAMLGQGDVALVKGSRAMKMEEIVDALLEAE